MRSVLALGLLLLAVGAAGCGKTCTLEDVGCPTAIRISLPRGADATAATVEIGGTRYTCGESTARRRVACDQGAVDIQDHGGPPGGPATVRLGDGRTLAARLTSKTVEIDDCNECQTWSGAAK
jgi:hypothetical protein